MVRDPRYGSGRETSGDGAHDRETRRRFGGGGVDGARQPPRGAPPRARDRRAHPPRRARTRLCAEHRRAPPAFARSRCASYRPRNPHDVRGAAVLGEPRTPAGAAHGRRAHRTGEKILGVDRDVSRRAVARDVRLAQREPLQRRDYHQHAAGRRRVSRFHHAALRRGRARSAHSQLLLRAGDARRKWSPRRGDLARVKTRAFCRAFARTAHAEHRGARGVLLRHRARAHRA